MGVYPVLGATEDGRGMVVTLVPRAVATEAQRRERQDSGWFTGTLQGNVPHGETNVLSQLSGLSVGFCLPPLGLP